MRGAMVVSIGVAGHALMCAAPLLLLPGGVSALGTARVAAVLLVLSVWVATEALAQPQGMRAARPPGGFDPLPAAMLLVVWASFVEAWADGGGGAIGPLAAAGFASAGAGVVLRLWAIRTLGERFLDDVALLPGHRLSRDGPYRLLRHPAETGNVLIAAGCAAVLGSAAGLVATVGVVLPLVLRRMWREEVLLAPLRVARAGRTR